MPGEAPTPDPAPAPRPPRPEFAARKTRFRTQRSLTLIRGLLPTVLLSKLLWWTAVFGGSSLLLGVYSPQELLAMTRDWARSGQGLDAIRALAILAVIWTALPFIARIAVDAALRKRTADLLTKQRKSRRARSRRLIRRYLIGFGVVVAGIGASLTQVERPWLLVGVFAITQAPLLAGLLATLGLFVVSGRRLRCATCGYEMGSWAAAPPRCPECGRNWKAPWGARAGTVVRSPRLLAAALAVFALSLGAAFLLSRAAMR